MADYNKDLYQSHLYCVWGNMKSRCTNPKDTNFLRYGARGISFCDKWKSFGGFFDDMADSCKDGLTLDRIDNNGNYCKENCRWATKKEQALNSRNIERATKIKYMGICDTITNWAKYIGIKRRTLSQRIINYHWSAERALTTGGLIGR